MYWLEATLLFCGALAAYKLWKGFEESPQLFYRNTERNRKIVNSCPNLKYFWTPFIYGFNGIIHTVLGEFWRTTPEICSFKEEYKTPDGGTLILTWAPIDKSQTPKVPRSDSTTPLVIIFPGLSLTPPNNYAINMMKQFQEIGWDSVMVNWRGTLSPLTSPKFYHFSDTGDIDLIMKTMSQKYPKAPIICIGFSMGANIMVKWLGQNAAKLPKNLIGSVSISNPYNIQKLYQQFEGTTKGKLLETFYLPRVKDMLQRSESVFMNSNLKDHYNNSMKAKTLLELESLHCNIYGYDSVSQLLVDSSSETYLNKISLPLFCVSAKDDPVSFVPEMNSFQDNSNIILCTTEKGGHTAWIHQKTGHSWCDTVTIEYMQSLFNEFVTPSSTAAS